MEKIPLFGFMYRKLHITVDRTKLKSRVNTLKKSMKAIDEGKSLVIFPEGGISMDGRLLPIKTGISRILMTHPVPVLPVGIANMHKACGKKKKMDFH